MSPALVRDLGPRTTGLRPQASEKNGGDREGSPEARSLRSEAQFSELYTEQAPVLLLEETLQGVARILFSRRYLAEQGSQGVAGGARFRATPGRTVAELVQIAGVRSDLLDDVLRLRFAALVGGGLVVVAAVDAGVQVGIALRAGGPTPHRPVEVQRRAAAKTGGCHGAIIIAMAHTQDSSVRLGLGTMPVS